MTIEEDHVVAAEEEVLEVLEAHAVAVHEVEVVEEVAHHAIELMSHETRYFSHSLLIEREE